MKLMKVYMKAASSKYIESLQFEAIWNKKATTPPPPPPDMKLFNYYIFPGF